jgi:hypothetical protein
MKEVEERLMRMLRRQEDQRREREAAMRDAVNRLKKMLAKNAEDKK